MKRPQTYHSEHHLQKVCIQWFDLTHPELKHRLFAIPNGGHRDLRVAKKLKAEGVRAGVWDLFLSVPVAGACGLFIESKMPKNSLTSSQKAFRQANQDHYAFAVIRSLDEFQSAVEGYMSGIIQTKTTYGIS